MKPVGDEIDAFGRGYQEPLIYVVRQLCPFQPLSKSSDDLRTTDDWTRSRVRPTLTITESTVNSELMHALAPALPMLFQPIYVGLSLVT